MIHALKKMDLASGMEIVRSVSAMQQRCLTLREQGLRIAFVPTMGWLHEGHLSLLRAGRRRGDVLVLSGQMGFPPGKLELVEGGITAQTHQIFTNIKAILEANNSSLDRVFKCTVMMGDISEWPKFNEVYVTYFSGDKPARSAFGANGLALGGSVEMECWATVKE